MIGRQITMPSGKRLDLLCIDQDGDLIVVELKGDRVWVNIPQTGFVSVGIVEEPSTPAKEMHFLVDGEEKRYTSVRAAFGISL